MLAPNKDHELFLQIKNLLHESRSYIVSQVNTTITKTYFEIGRIILEDEQKGSTKAMCGKNTLKNLSSKLTVEFGKGFSVQKS